MPEPKDDLQKVHEAVNALREEYKTISPNLEKIEKIESFLDKQEEMNQEFQKKQAAQEAKELELKEKVHDLELELARATPSQEKDIRQSAEYKNLEVYVKSGRFPAEVDEKTLRTDVDTAGGYLAPAELDNMIIKKIIEISDIRSIARVRSTSNKTLDIAVRDTIPTATFEGEAEPGSDSESTYKRETVTPFRLTFTTPITQDMLMDSAFNMEAELLSDAAEAFAKGEGTGFVNGSGFKEPEGFLQNATVTANPRISSTSGVVEAKDVILLTGDLKVGYNPVYVMNRRTLADLRTKESTTGQFLWQPGLNGPVANTINGYPYILADDMPDVASNSLSIAFGDFRAGYNIIDRTGLSVVRDEYSLKKLAIVEFTLSKWVTGQVVLPEAIKLLKTAA